MNLDEDTISCILSYLDTEVHIARATMVCRRWRKLVIEGGFWKRLCLKHFPELEQFKGVKYEGSSSGNQLEMESFMYSRLYSRIISREQQRNCILDAVSASNIRNSPEEDIAHTLHPYSKFAGFPSYWSSNGENKTEVPEFLTYKLVTPLCVVNEIKVRAFQAYFQAARPIYSSEYVRFKMGYPAGPENTYVWVYTSPLFPMEQITLLQSFRLPRPVVCIGSIVQVELIGRVQTQRCDELYYICICHVSVEGHPIPGFDIEIIDEKQLLLKECKEEQVVETHDEDSVPLAWMTFRNTLRRNPQMPLNLQRDLNLFLQDYDMSDGEDELL